MAEDHHAIVLSEIVLRKITAIIDSELAHLAIRKFDAAGLDRHNPRADFVAETGARFGAHGANDGHFIANRFHICVLVFDLFPRSLPAGLQTRLPGPQDDYIVSHVQESVQNTTAKTLSIGEQEDYRRQSPNNAEHGQSGAQTIPEKRLPALRDELS